jgi:hypothetical protein
MSAAYPEPHESGVSATDGWTGSDASHERAVAEQQSGKAQQHREMVVHALGEQTGHGLTYRELGDLFDWHHGQSSSVLSVLHKERRIARLQDRRNRCHIYVLPEYVDGRETREAGRTAPHRADLDAEAEAMAKAAWQAGHDVAEQGVQMRIGIARDAGWQTGYDAAMDEVAQRPTAEDLTETAFSDGKIAGRNEEALRMLRLVTTMRDSIKKTQGNRMHNHSGVCWMENPACALDSVEKAVARSLPTPPRPRQPL